jgi:uncharacterized protein YqcC (DUF446 family)
MTTILLTEKLSEIKIEMKKLDLWKKQVPIWVNDYAERSIATEDDFTGWLQFVYLPNVMQKESSAGTKKLIVPQALQFLGEDIQKGTLLQLLIELDSLL